MKLKCCFACAEIAGLFKGRRAILEQLEPLFKERPIWSTAAIKQWLSGIDNADMDILTPRLAYVFRNGEDPHGFFTLISCNLARRGSSVHCSDDFGLHSHQCTLASKHTSRCFFLSTCPMMCMMDRALQAAVGEKRV